jgi:hypothetical protein
LPADRRTIDAVGVGPVGTGEQHSRKLDCFSISKLLVLRSKYWINIINRENNVLTNSTIHHFALRNIVPHDCRVASTPSLAWACAASSKAVREAE